MKPAELFNKLRDVTYTNTGLDFDWHVDIDHEEKVIRAMFKESSSNLDWFFNFLFLVIPTIIGGTPYWFSLGWWTSWCSCKEFVMFNIMHAIETHPGYEVQCCGFSYGGAEAQICGITIYELCGIKPTLITFGAPRPLFGFFTWLAARRCFKEVKQYAHWSDLITWCIPLFGYCTVKNTRIGKFSLKKLFNPYKYHQIYSDETLYKE